jgi:hypothetical protein
MTDQLFTPSELLLYGEQFCSAMYSASRNVTSETDREELLLRIGQSRGLIEQLQIAFNDDKLDLARAATREQFRCLLLCLHWAAYYGRTVLDRSAFKRLILADATFTRLLMGQIASK